MANEDSPVQVIVVLDGGLVRQIISSREDVSVMVIDTDTEGVEPEEIAVIEHGDNALEGTTAFPETECRPECVKSAFERLA